MSQENQNVPGVAEEVYQELLQQIETWVQECEEDGTADRAIAYGGTTALTPRLIRDQVRNRSPEGIRIIATWKELLDERDKRNNALKE